jgi:molybdopterin molybdotransferase
MSDTGERRHAGFKHRTRVAAAQDTLAELVPVLDRTETVPLEEADGRVIATEVTADRNVPHYPRAAMDGYAVRAADTFGASDRSPTVVRIAADEAGGPGEAVRVHTGSELPDGANAVVMIEHVEELGGELEVYDAVAEGENVGPIGEDIEAGRTLFEPGHQLRPSDLGLLKSVDVREVPVRAEPEVAVIPTGEEVVQSDPAPGEVIETNGLTVSRLVERWGGSARYREVVTDDEERLRQALETDLDADILVTTGGSSVGARDLTPDVVEELGEVTIHGVAVKPGHPVALGRVAETPILLLPGYPVSCIVNAWLFLRPAIKWALGTAVNAPPTVQARLDRKLRSEPGMRTLARVQLERGDAGEDGVDREGGHQDEGGDEINEESDDGIEDESEEWVATPVSASGAGVLSTVALADGWVQIPESREGIPAGETVAVEMWEALP